MKLTFTFILVLSLFNALAVEIEIDVSELKSSSPIFLSESSILNRIPTSGMINLDVKHLPTLIKIVSIDKGKIVTHKIIWLKGDSLKIKGSISDDNVELLPSKGEEQLNTGIEEEWNKLVLTSEYSLTEPYLVHILNNIKFIDSKNLKSIVEQLPENKHHFWAVKDLVRYLDNLEKVGFDPLKKEFSHLEVTNKGGERQLFQKPKDKFLLIDFSSSGCRPCLEDIDKLVALNNDFEGKLEILSVWEDPKQEPWLNIAKKQKDKITWVSLRDDTGAIFRKFNIDIFPTYLLIDQSGEVVKKWEGSGIDKVRKYLK